MQIDVYTTSSPTTFIIVEAGVDPKEKMPRLLHGSMAPSRWKLSLPLNPPPGRGIGIGYDANKAATDIKHLGFHISGAKVTHDEGNA